MRVLRSFLVTLGSTLALILALRVVFVVAEWTRFGKLSIGELVHAFVFGLRFDLSLAASVALLAGVVELFLHFVGLLDRARTTVRIVLALSLVAMMAGDGMYFAETGQHVTYEVRDTGGQWTSLVLTALRAHFGLLAVHAVVAAIAIVALMKSSRSAKASAKESWPSRIVGGLASIALAVVLIRGGLQPIPLEPAHAFELGDPTEAALALDGAYSELAALLSPSECKSVALPAADSIDPVRVLGPSYPSRRESDHPLDVSAANALAANRPNVVVVLLEGWAALYMRSYFGKHDCTPFFDELRARSLSTDLTITDGHRTSMGVFSIFCSFQNPLGQTVARSNLQFERYDSLASILRDRGWHTAFFQGTNKETSGVGSFAQTLGFEESFGREDMPSGRYPDHSWGKHDPDVFDFALERMRAMPRPFLAAINTNTTHSRELPSGVAPFVEGSSNEAVTSSALKFADDALRVFIGDAERANLGPTIFVLVADHTSYVEHGGFMGHAIPFLIYAPGLVEPKRIADVSHHRDIAPTLLDLVGIPIPDGFAGRSLVADSPTPRFADYSSGAALGWVEGDLVIEVPTHDAHSVRAWNWRDDPEQANVLAVDRIPPAMIERALAFGRYSQSLLFSGRTQSFRAGLRVR